MRTLHFPLNSRTDAGSSNPAGRYSTGVSAILGSTMLSQLVMDRVSVSQACEMYFKIGFRPCFSVASAGAAAVLVQNSSATRNEQNELRSKTHFLPNIMVIVWSRELRHDNRPRECYQVNPPNVTDAVQRASDHCNFGLC